MKTKTNSHILHTPVLLEETLKTLSPHKGESYLDLTAGYGGHALEVIKRTKMYSRAILCDRDIEAINHLKSITPKGVHLLHNDYLSATQALVKEGARFSMIMIDLGVSSLHLDKANRGFSMLKEGPLDMRMDQSQQITAEYILNNASEQELTRIIKNYGEEPKARAVARSIVASRPLRTTFDLAECVKRVYRVRMKTHPATRTFQAVRIAVNQELEQLAKMLLNAEKLLEPGGRMAIIAFHSLEDRIVKKWIVNELSMGYEATMASLTKKPITPSLKEISLNPRARSAKLRAVVKINKKGYQNAH